MSDCTPQTPYRQTWDTTEAAFIAELAGSPVAAEADALCDDASPYQRLYLAHSKVENAHDTNWGNVPGAIIEPDQHNNLALRCRGYPEEQGERGGFAVFASYRDCCAAWRRRLTDPALCYVAAVPLIEYCACYCPAGDVHPGSGVENDPAAYCDGLLATINRLPLEGAMPDELVFGRVPHPAFTNRVIPDAQNGAWNALGPVTVLGVVWHRMEGSLWGTDGWFRRGPNPENGGSTGLTAYGVGVAAMDGAENDGVILAWNDPLGRAAGGVSPHRAPWASGPVNGPYGDGLAFLEDHGMDYDVVNRDQAAIEISGQYGTALSEKSRDAIAGITAYWADQAKIPHDQFPIIPGKGYSFVRWHEEFCKGSGKTCPGTVVKDETDDLIARTAAILAAYQAGEDVAPPEPPSYAAPDVPGFFAQDPRPAVVDYGADAHWVETNRRWAATKSTPRYQYATRDAASVSGNISAGEEFTVHYTGHVNGEWWALLQSGTRVCLSDCRPV